MKTLTRTLSLLMLVWTLAGCSLLPASRPVVVYRLPPSPQAPSPAPKVAWALRIARPAASDMLAGSRMLVIPAGNQVSAYGGVRWSAPVPTLWRDRLVEAFLADGRVRHVSSDSDNLQADYELGASLLAFQSEYRHGQPVVHIRLEARLVETDSRRILASRNFEELEQPQGSAVPAVVTAFGLASSRLERALIDWTLSQPAPSTAAATNR